jgi:oligoendopeptidase F
MEQGSLGRVGHRGGRRFFPFVVALSLVGALGALAMAQGKAPYKPNATAARSEVPSRYHWNLAAIFPSVDEWEKSFAELGAALPTLEDCKGQLAKSAEELKRCLDRRYGLEQALRRLNTYAFAEFSTDRQVAAAQTRHDRTQQLATAFNDAIAFMEPELLAMDAARIERFLKQEEGLAGLPPQVPGPGAPQGARAYAGRPSACLALSGDLQSGPYAMLNALQQDTKFSVIKDEDGNDVELAFANFPRYRGSQGERSVRRAAVETFFGRLREHERSFAASLDMGVKRDIFVARARSYGVVARGLA